MATRPLVFTGKGYNYYYYYAFKEPVTIRSGRSRLWQETPQ